MTNNQKQIKPVFSANKIIQNIVSDEVLQFPLLSFESIELETLQISLDGERFYSMDRLNELISLGKKYERAIERGGKMEYPFICAICQQEKCICEIMEGEE